MRGLRGALLLSLVCSIALSVSGQSAQAPVSSTTFTAQAPTTSAQGPSSPGPNTLNVPPASQICPDSLVETLAGQNLVESPQPFAGVPSSWGQTVSASSLAVSSDRTYIAVTNRAGPGSGAALTVNNMQVGSFYKVGAYVKISGSTNEKLRMTFNFNGNDYKCAAIVSVAYSDCYTLVLGAITGPASAAPLNSVKLFITGNEGSDVQQAPFEIDIYSVAVVGVNRATWLADVQQRTDLVRKRDVIVTVKDAFGNPVPNATISINQLNQTFPFGSDLHNDAYNDTAYRNWFASKWGNGYSWTAYNSALKWYAMQPDELNVTTVQVINQQNWLNNNSISVRGHTIFWDDVGTTQDWVKLIADTDPVRLFGYMQLRINDVVGLFKNAIRQWDPSNELMHKNYFSSKLGFDVKPWYFNRTKTLDPTGVTFFSDYNIVEACDDGISWPESAIEFVKYLRRNGGPVDAFAVQGQFTSITPFLLRFALDKLGQFGIPIWMSEVNLRLASEPYSAQAQRDNFELIVRELYAHPAVDALLLSQTWTPLREWMNGTCDGNKCLYNYDYTLRPVGTLWENLYYNEWMTTGIVGRTNAAGQFAFRGFAGKYNATVNGTFNSTHAYQTSYQFVVEPLNTTVNVSTYATQTAAPYVAFTNGTIVSNASIPANLTQARRTYNISQVTPNGGFYNLSSTLDVSTPFINIYTGSDNIAGQIYHLEKTPGNNNLSSYRVVPGSAPQTVTVVAPLTPLNRYPISTVQTFVIPT
ncbi:Glycosyl hydrolase family 10 protein [Klebsormidium nitens]|uniref:Glycosyl hydrolase family 10 protein n=1 Tax=Klebsormidium nitens TaxID=105231 RepID=A0A1Y1HXR6_KLENI|nr:Glycosyl hydrolase family 10 protein [Klebsormidium nitens]|eukprot:GAQ83460.1 Glycosyl hydrolase family 10 protein [Klebsormidium nitens]